VNEEPDIDLPIPGGALLRALGHLFPPKPSRLDVLREKLLELELVKATTGGAVAYQAVPFGDLAAVRRDWVVCGLRGSGKTAAAVAIARAMAEQNGMRAVGVGWSPSIAARVGLEAVAWPVAKKLERAVLVLDEFRLLEVPPAELWRVLALGRQRECATIATAQSTAAVTPDVFRIGVALGWKSVDVVAAQFEREELREVAVTARMVLAQVPPPHGLASLVDGSWIASANPLPAGWSEEVSRLWAGR